MARLQDASGNLILLSPHHLIGRSRALSTTLRSADVSAQHVAIVWTGAAWTVRDLASRNGTWLDGRRLEAGEVAPLAKGAVLLLGSPSERLTLVDDAPPAPCARAGELLLEGSGELLAIPSPEEPVAVVLVDPDLGWILSMDDATSPVRDGQELVVAGTRWRLCLPESLDRTVEARNARAQTAEVGLLFKVSSDEEYVELTVRFAGKEHRLPARVHHYLLLTLARARQAEPELPETERGWVYTADLLKMLRLSSNQLYVSLHRARKELDGLGLPPGFDLIERRPTTHQVRIGTGDLQVQTL